MDSGSLTKYHAFICHASEDKEPFVRQLAAALTHAGLSIWYDEFSMKLGDSLRQSIEKGIAQSSFGVVVLSPRFFQKAWPQGELNGLFAKELNQGKTIIPIWYEIDHAQLVAIAPIIADKVAAKASDGINRVVEQVLDVIDPGNYHRTKTGATVTVVPRRFRVQAGQWSVRTPVRVSNRGSDILYSLSLVFRISGAGYRAEDIEIDIPSPTIPLRSSQNMPPVSCDALFMAGLDSDGNEVFLIAIPRLPAGEDRDIVFSGRKSLGEGEEGICEVKTIDFSREPVEFLMEGQGKVAIKFMPPENLTIRSVAIKMA